MHKPACYGYEHASAFQEISVAAAYTYRPPYPPHVFTLLAQLLPEASQRLLDAGCGTGALARYLLHLGIPIDAVDISAAMIAHGKHLPYADHALLHWHVGAIETVDLTPPYGLITVGESLHWMDWDSVLPRFARMLQPDGKLVVLELAHEPMPWDDELRELIKQFSTNQAYQAVDLIAELTNRGLFIEEGRTTLDPWVFIQTIDAYVESFHGRASFSRERMSATNAAAFDYAVRTAVASRGYQQVALPIVATMVWGKPLLRE